jgi:GNAT superfamily N-acetyltransferase
MSAAQPAAVLASDPILASAKEGPTMFSAVNLYTNSLGNGLILKSVGAPEDVERLAAFNRAIHGPEADDLTRNLLLHHPTMNPDYWLFVEDETTGAIVSSLCLIPWTWRFEDVTLKVGEMGIVGTLPEYRHRGLIRALDRRFKELLRDEGFHLSQIQGIPYFYRQLGYEYCLPLEGGWHIELHQIPGEPLGSAERFTFRRATLDDAPMLRRLADESARGLNLSAVRDEAVWRYLLQYSDVMGEAWLVLDVSSRPVGHFTVQKFGFGEGLNVGEVADLSADAAFAALCQMKKLAVERGKPFVRLNVAGNSALVRAALAWGASDQGRYAWQVLIPDPARFLRQIGPLLERRIADSPFAGLTQTVRINLYREAVELRFEGGKLIAVESVGFRDFADGNDLNLPPTLLPVLALGWRNVKQLRETYPDVGTWGPSAYLIDVLFPQTEAYFYTQY